MMSEEEKQDVAKESEALAEDEGKRKKGFPNWLKQLLLVLVIVAIGFGLAVLLIVTRKQPERKEFVKLAPLVKTVELNVRDIQMKIDGFGTVKPKVEIEIVPQVGGNVVWVNKNFKPGGFVKAEEEILKIDPRDYELAVQQADALVAEAKVKLDLEEAEAKVARQEWEQINPGEEPSSPLVLREPQIRQAKAQLESADAKLEMARLGLARTKVSLPVDARIFNERIDLGQFVRSGESVGSAYGIDLFEIELPLEDEELAWFEVPEASFPVNGMNLNKGRVNAEIRANFAGGQYSWDGYVKRTTGQVDKTSRLVYVVIDVPEPFGNEDGKPPLLPGTFVEVLIEGTVLKDAVAIPRNAVHNGNEVWVVKDGRLHIQSLDILRNDNEYAYVNEGLEDGAVIVTSSLDAVTEGMAVRTSTEAKGSSETRGD